MLKEGLKRELNEKIGFIDDFNPIISHYFDEIKVKDNKKIHNLEIDFIINVDKSKVNINLSNEYTEYKWVPKNSELLDNFIKDKLSNID